MKHWCSSLNLTSDSLCNFNASLCQKNKKSVSLSVILSLVCVKVAEENLVSFCAQWSRELKPQSESKGERCSVRVTEGKGGDFWSFSPLAHIKLVWVEVERKEKKGTVGRFKAEVVRLLFCPISGSIMLNARTRASDGTQLREARPTLPPPPSSTYLTPPLHPCLPPYQTLPT